MTSQQCSWITTQGCLSILEQVAWNKSSLLSLSLKITLENTQTLKPFTKITKTEIIYKKNSIRSLKTWVKRSSGLIKRGRRRKCFKREYLD